MEVVLVSMAPVNRSIASVWKTKYWLKSCMSFKDTYFVAGLYGSALAEQFLLQELATALGYHLLRIVGLFTTR